MHVTECAQHAVLSAKEEAGRPGHDHVGAEHLLLGLLRDEQCLAVATLGGLGIAAESVRRRVEETVCQCPGAPGMGLGPADDHAATLVLSLARRETMELDHDRVGTEDLLLGLAREGEGVAARVLQELGAGLLELREAVAAQYAAGVNPEPFPPDRGPPPSAELCCDSQPELADGAFLASEVLQPSSAKWRTSQPRLADAVVIGPCGGLGLGTRIFVRRMPRSR